MQKSFIYVLWFRYFSSSWKHWCYINLSGMEVLCSTCWSPSSRSTLPSLWLRLRQSSLLLTLISDLSSAWRFYIKWIWREGEGVTTSFIHSIHQPKTAVLPGTVAALWPCVRMWYLCIKPPCVLWSLFWSNLDPWCFCRFSGDAINSHNVTHPSASMYSIGLMQPLQLCASWKTPEISCQIHSVYEEGL